jgi:hypothetical protein
MGSDDEDSGASEEPGEGAGVGVYSLGKRTAAEAVLGLAASRKVKVRRAPADRDFSTGFFERENADRFMYKPTKSRQQAEVVSAGDVEKAYRASRDQLFHMAQVHHDRFAGLHGPGGVVLLAHAPFVGRDWLPEKLITNNKVLAAEQESKMFDHCLSASYALAVAECNTEEALAVRFPGVPAAV